jgi:sugar lactone lactonase YvrE
MSPLRKAMDRWLGRGDASITMPPMDGAFRPNDLLDSAPAIIETPEPDCLAVTSHGVVASAGRSLLAIDRLGGALVAAFDAEISALAGLPDGGAAVALIDGRIVFVGGHHGGTTLASVPAMNCITALAPARDGTLLVANGSASNGPAAWKRDLMEKNASGSVWRVEPASALHEQLAGDLAYPYGLLEEAGSVVVSESWRSALTRIPLGGKGRNQPVLANLPAYPSRLSRDADNMIWLALFAPRSQLVEFVLREDRYRRRMIGEINPDHWIAPCLRAGRTPKEPTQQGGVKQLGVLKPWSPTRSYGLVARLDHTYRPTASLHSRAHGHRHGVTSCLAVDGRLFFVAKGDGVVASRPYERTAP